MKILTIETTCDETAAAVITDDLQILSSVVASQEELHREFSGVVPELAARAHVERMLPVVGQALQRAGTTIDRLAAVAVATEPGLAGSLVVGLTAAKAIGVAAQIPLIAINHLHAHIYACRIASRREIFPCVGMIISGGHSHIYHCRDALDFALLGGTIDDAAGEAFDKVASMLQLGFPGGPKLSRAAESGDPQRYRFPRSFIRDPDIKFSFSGLKTAVRYELAGPGKVDFSQLRISRQRVADIAASFEAAVVDCLVTKAMQAIEQTGLSTLCVGGGVAANRRFRRELQSVATQREIDLQIAPPELCTDNAVMGAIAWEHFRRGSFADLSTDIRPGLIRP